MKDAKEVSGYYGSHKIPCIVFYYDGWYACEDSLNVNHTPDEVEDGVNVEELYDDDMFTAPRPINSLEELIDAVNL